MAAASLLTVTGTQVFGEDPAADPTADTGFTQPFSGPEVFEWLAPTKTLDPSLINVKIGVARADAIAFCLGLDKSRVLTKRQFKLFITGRGVKGDPEAAKLADESVRIFNNTSGNPLISKVKGKPTTSVLGSYGLYATEDGWLQSLANMNAPTREANFLLEPPSQCQPGDPPYCGYIDRWFRHNNARDSLEMLYASAFKVEAAFGLEAQLNSNAAQLVPNTKGGDSTQVGMSMAPSIWLTNFALLYTLNPKVAAKMPAYWTPIPENVADAIQRNPHGRVRYSRFVSELKNE